MGDQLPNPMANSPGDFIGFSSSPGHNREDRFQPRRGKRNRQDNWQRFGQFEQGQRGHFYSPRGRGGHGGAQNSPYFHSTPNWTQDRHQSHGRWRGNNQQRDRRNQHQNYQKSASYFHPSMLEDPWANLGKNSSKFSESSKNSFSVNDSLSDSLRPQVGDSVINPAPEVSDSFVDDPSQYSFNSEKNDAQTTKQSSTSDDMTLSSEIQEPSLSDSMIPLVGDSILERNME